MRATPSRLLSSRAAYVALASLGFLGMYFVPMRWGARVMGADGLSYITAARELISGRGLYILDGLGGFLPLVHWPPGFPLVLAAFSLVGIGPIEVARLLNSLLLAANSLAIGYLLRRHGPKVSWLPILGMGAFLGSTTVLKIHADAMSEALFVWCLLMTFVFLLQYLETNRKLALVVCAAFVGWGVLTRYIGVTLVLTGVTMLVVHSRHALRKAVVDSLIFGVLASVPIGLWLFRNSIATGKPTNRVLGWHPPDHYHWLALETTFMNWLVPSSYPSGLRTICALVALCFIVAVFLLRKPRLHVRGVDPFPVSSSKALLAVSLLLGLYYGLFLCFSILFVDTIQYPDERLMFPIYLCGLLALMSAVGDVWLKDKQRWQKTALLCALCGFIALGFVRSGVWAYVAQRDGWGGYNAPEKRFSETLAFVRSEPKIDFSKIISNDHGAIYYWTSKSTVEIPPMYYDFYRGLPAGGKVGDIRQDFGALWMSVEQKIGPEWLLIYFYQPMASGAFVFPSERELRKRLKLTLLHTFQDGSVYCVR